jgi:hypothetical protein
MSERLFDAAYCLAAWRLARRSHQLGFRLPPPWPAITQAWFDRDLAQKLIPARLYARQVVAARKLSPVVPLRRYGALRFNTRIS